MGYIHEDPTCKKEGCSNMVKYGMSQGKVFCSNTCRNAHRKAMEKAGMPSQFDVSEKEALDRKIYLDKAKAGSKAALLYLYTRWGITSLYNPSTKQKISL